MEHKMDLNLPVLHKLLKSLNKSGWNRGRLDLDLNHFLLVAYRGHDSIL